MSIMARLNNGNKLGGAWVTCLSRAIKKLTAELDPPANNESDIKSLASIINKEKPKKPEVCILHVTLKGVLR
jgi:hypothetical protein